MSPAGYANATYAGRGAGAAARGRGGAGAEIGDPRGPLRAEVTRLSAATTVWS